MRVVFADTGYWVAFIQPRDQLHEKAKAVSKSLGECRIITSEMVCAELLNYFASRGPYLRRATVKMVDEIKSNANVTIKPMTSVLFRDAFKLYRDRPDKDWSLTDCASHLIMQEGHIQEALAHDKHFEQGGFMALLRTVNNDGDKS